MQGVQIQPITVLLVWSVSYRTTMDEFKKGCISSTVENWNIWLLVHMERIPKMSVMHHSLQVITVNVKYILARCLNSHFKGFFPSQSWEQGHEHCVFKYWVQDIEKIYFLTVWALNNTFICYRYWINLHAFVVISPLAEQCILRLKSFYWRKYVSSQHGLVLYWQVISHHQLLINACIITTTGIDADASKGETLLGYLTAIWFNQVEAVPIFSGRWIPYLFFLVPISSDIHVVQTFLDMSGARRSCWSWPDCSLWPFP